MVQDYNPAIPPDPDVNTPSNRLSFTYLQDFVRFLRDECMDPLIREMLVISRKVDLPLLRYFESMGDEYLIDLSRKSYYEIFTSIIEDRAMAYLLEENERWLTDQLPLISKFEIRAEDITLASYIRRMGMRSFLRQYPGYAEHGLAILDELDDYLLASDTLATETYLSLLKNRINEEVHFNEKITETTPGIIYVYDIREHRQVYTNRQVETLLGYPAEDLRDMEQSDLVLLQHPEDRPRLMAHYSQFPMASDGEVRTVEHRMKDNSGSYRWLRNYESVFKRSPDGTVREIIGISLDITGEKENEEQLVRGQEQLLEAQSIAGLGSFEWNTETGVVIGSPQFLKLFELAQGSSRGEMISRIHPDDRPTVDTESARALKERGLYNCEYRYRGESREKVIWTRGRIVERNGIIHMKGTAMDVTARHELVSRLQESETLYKKAQAISHIGNWEWEVATNRLSWSDELYCIYGLEPQSVEVSYDAIAAFNHPDDAQSVQQQMKVLMEDHKDHDFIYRIVLQDGTVKTLQAKGAVKLDKAGAVEKVFGTLQDVSRQVESELILQQKNLQLKQSNASLEEFAYVASHDLREPLRKIVTFGGMLTRQSSLLDREGQLYLTKITESANRMQLMIDDLLSLSLISGNKLFEQYSLQSILAEVTQNLEYKIEQCGAVIEADSLPAAHIIPSQFRQVFQNLISNSLKFARPGLQPHIRITAAYLQPREAEEHGLVKGNTYLKLCFRDNGIGFENEYADKIFVMFQRLHGKSEFEGNGIGLAICRKIIENHAGLLYAQGIPGEGATFTIILPS